ncbi:hypothetical protein U4960_15785 [Altererythrobacter sp. H2]|uniref:hypothetical protein n=1 Tax=Altererythrobacter sp. H2 TaxID=3108391 RepID=UPI002B4BBE39|nr:hypothetical protein [Altererythrobacter sp. H2]WRK95713.1 hypothetical protein U4960_15785 [Altererythrobacter sp. H2]
MTKFVVQQQLLGLSACQRLCGTSSAETEKLAWQAGWRGLPGQSMQPPLGTVINMMVLSIGRSNGVELDAMGAWLPRLRDEAVLKLAAEATNWSFNGSDDDQRDFWPLLYGDDKLIRSRIGSLLGCYSDNPTRQLRVHSQRDVEHLSYLQVERGLNSGRPPLFTIDAHDIARQVTCNSSAPFFTAKSVQI